MRKLLIAALCILLAPWAQAQRRPAPNDFTVNMFVNYGFAYRNLSWAPVDVLVQNNKRDIKGWLEVRTFDFNGPQSPVYRVPIESPKGSTKRFQVHCFLRETEHVEAQLYDGRHAVLDIPARWQAQPIKDEDLLAIVLDDDGGSGFGFLYNVANATAGDRGLHRENLDSETLAFLSDHPRAYEAVDMILIGRIDPEKIGVRQRAVLFDYVRGGGTVVVCTGKNAKYYRGTWVEELLGAQIGPEEPVREGDFARAVFASDELQGVKEDRDCIVASLTPTLPGVKAWGGERTLATRRSIGMGNVYAFAVDVEERALQDATAFTGLWRQICTNRPRAQRLNYESAAVFACEALPLVSGVVIHSKASVMKYLALYFLVGIVGNWLFFSWLKRREWAWAMLVVFSFAFTAYAMIFGTTGRARASELEQVEVLRVPRDGGLARRDAFVGVLTAHSDTYDMALAGEYALARDMREDWTRANMPQPTMGLGGSARPFALTQGDQARIEGFRVGASDIRLLRVESDLELPGGIDGELVLDSNGLNGELVNHTGRVLDGQDTYLFYNGQLIRVGVVDGKIKVALPSKLIDQVRPDMLESFQNPMRYGGPVQRLAPATLRRWMAGALLAPPQTVTYSNMAVPLRSDLGPYLVAWTAKGSSDSAVKPTQEVQRNLDETLIIADIQITRTDAANSSVRPLEAWLRSNDENPPNQFARQLTPARMWVSPLIMACPERVEAAILLPASLDYTTPSGYLVDLYWRCEDSTHNFIFQPKNAPADWWKTHRVDETWQPDGVTHRDTYRIDPADQPTEPVDPNEFAIARPETYLIAGQSGMGALGNFNNRGHTLQLDMSSPFKDIDPVGRMLPGLVLRNPEEAPCQTGAEHNCAVAVTARAQMPSDAARRGEESKWR